MIWLKEGEKLISNRIVSVNEEALKKFISIERDNVVLISHKYDIVSTIPLKKSTTDGYIAYENLGWAGTSDKDRIAISTYRYKKLLAYKMALEAVNSKSDRIFDLRDFFKNWELDLEKLQTVSSVPIFMEYVEQAYADYSGFLNILPHIEFETIASYNVEELNQIVTLMQNNSMDTSHVEEILKQEGIATTNSKILSLTRNFVK